MEESLLRTVAAQKYKTSTLLFCRISYYSYLERKGSGASGENSIWGWESLWHVIYGFFSLWRQWAPPPFPSHTAENCSRSSGYFTQVCKEEATIGYERQGSG